MPPTRHDFLQEPGFASLLDACVIHLPTGLVVLTDQPGPCIIDPSSSNHVRKEAYDPFRDLWKIYVPMSDPDYKNYVCVDSDPSLTNLLEVRPLLVCSGCNRACFSPSITRAKGSSTTHAYHSSLCTGELFRRCCGFELLSTPKKYIVLNEGAFTSKWLDEHKKDFDVSSVPEETDKKPAMTMMNSNGAPALTISNGPIGGIFGTEEVIEISDVDSDSDASIDGEPLTTSNHVNYIEEPSGEKSPTQSDSESQPHEDSPPLSNAVRKDDNNKAQNDSRSNSNDIQSYDAMDRDLRKKCPLMSLTARKALIRYRLRVRDREENAKRNANEHLDRSDESPQKKQKVDDTASLERVTGQDTSKPSSDDEYDEATDGWSDVLIKKVKKQVMDISRNSTQDLVSKKFTKVWKEYLESGVPSFVSQMLLSSVKFSIEGACTTLSNYVILVGPGRIDISESTCKLTITITISNSSNDCKRKWNIRVIVADDTSDSDDDVPNKYQYLEQYEANDLILSELCRFIIIQRTFLINLITGLSIRKLSLSENKVCQASWRVLEDAKLSAGVAIEVIKFDASKLLSHGI